jgi:hypothetical protein
MRLKLLGLAIAGKIRNVYVVVHQCPGGCREAVVIAPEAVNKKKFAFGVLCRIVPNRGATDVLAITARSSQFGKRWGGKFENRHVSSL